MHPKAIIVCDEEALDELKVATVRYFKALEGPALEGPALEGPAIERPAPEGET
jgi:hypothetical protein